MLNLDLVQAGCRTLGQKGILPAKLGLPDGRTAEWYFDQLRPQLAGQPTAGDGSGKPYAGCGSGSGAAPAPGEIDGAGAGVTQGAGDVERELVRINTAAAIRQHAEQRGRGSVPGGLLQEADQVLSPPKVPWQQVLAPAIRRAVASRAGHYDIDPSAAPRHRRRHRVDIAPGKRIVYPGTYSPKPTLVLIRDTSGSVSDADLELVTSEVVGIATGMGIRGRDLRVMDVDAAVQHTADYTDAAGLARIHGRGGTDLRVGIQAALELKPRPHAIVVFTDGETPWPSPKPAVPVIVCLVGDTAAATADRVPEWAVPVVVGD